MFIPKVGYFYDEYLHAVSTQKLITGNKLFRSDVPQVLKSTIFDRNYPLLILYYVGSIKTYYLLLIFYIFGSSIQILRYSIIFLSVINILLIYYFVKKYFDQKSAYLSTILLITDPTYIYSSIFDWGPISTQQILKTILILLAFKLANSNKILSLNTFYIGFISLILVFDKLNGIWFLAPLYLYLTYNLFINNNLKPKLFKGLLLGILIGAIPLIIIFYKRPYFYYESKISFKSFENYYHNIANNPNSLNLTKNYSSKFSDKLTTFIETLNGTSIPNHILTVATKPTVTNIIFISIFLGILANTIINLYKRTLNHFDYLVLITIFTFTLVILTPHANGTHHFLILWPFPQMILGIWFLKMYTSHKFAITALIFSIVIGNILSIHSFYTNLEEKNMKTYWRVNSIEKLVANLSTQKNYVALDWGISLPVVFATNGHILINDLQPFYDPKCNQLMYSIETVYVAHKDTEEVFPDFRIKCKDQLDKYAIDEFGDFRLYYVK